MSEEWRNDPRFDGGSKKKTIHLFDYASQNEPASPGEFGQIPGLNRNTLPHVAHRFTSVPL